MSYDKIIKRRSTATKLLLLCSIAIMSLLVFAASSQTASGNAEQITCRVNLMILDGAIMQFQAANGNFPENVEQLIPNYLKSLPTCPDSTSGTYSFDQSTSPPIARCSVHGTELDFHMTTEWLAVDWPSLALKVSIFLMLLAGASLILFWPARQSPHPLWRKYRIPCILWFGSLLIVLGTFLVLYTQDGSGYRIWSGFRVGDEGFNGNPILGLFILGICFYACCSGYSLMSGNYSKEIPIVGIILFALAACFSTTVLIWFERESLKLPTWPLNISSIRLSFYVLTAGAYIVLFGFIAALQAQREVAASKYDRYADS